MQLHRIRREILDMVSRLVTDRPMCVEVVSGTWYLCVEAKLFETKGKSGKYLRY